MRADLIDRLGCVGRTWTPQQLLHVGNVAWSWSRGDGTPDPDLSLAWGEPLRAYADLWRATLEPATATLHIDPGAGAIERSVILGELRSFDSAITLFASRQDQAQLAALEAAGFVDAAGPWFAQLWRTMSDLSDLEELQPPAGYRIVAVDPADPAAIRERVELHRRSWRPDRIRRLLGMPDSGTTAESSYSEAKHRAVMATPIYRPELDLVALDPDGRWAGYALGWLDQPNGSLLIEPVGTDPDHVRRGLARALCATLLRTARDFGAREAVVGPRGDDRYPLPRRLYQGLGMREVAQFVRFSGPPR
ncbi:GNAT family N-acetyltransferase [Microlunatus speluncae]|uniref:GNAT family N-acetyltransferase n=1 Tax=Microlunatus speluncae TaxID=2594267 RepID=UPI0012663246|nr:GNAT family N-acetyltransferase [Microlunatus speluncae]